MELKVNVDFYEFEKMFGDLLVWANKEQISDIYDYFEELSMCVDDLDEMMIRDIISFDMNVDTHDDIINMYDCIKEHMDNHDCDLYEALGYYTTIYSYGDDEVVYAPF